MTEFERPPRTVVTAVHGMDVIALRVYNYLSDALLSTSGET
jgi:hypothetical protein